MKTKMPWDRVIEFMQLGRRSHLEWAEYFEANPDIEKRYVATGEWSDAKTHREWVAAYDEVLKKIL